MILIIEDDLQLQAFLAQQLQAQGAAVATAGTCAQASRLVDTPNPPEAGVVFYIVDRGLPDGDGQQWLAARRRLGDNTPALLLTALGALADKVEGLQLADDYLVKPFDFAELWARLQSIQRRQAKPPLNLSLLIGSLRIDRLARRVHRGQEEIVLKPVEYKLLDCFLTHQGEILTRTMLLELVWGYDFDPATNLVETYISRLRAKIDTPGEASLILTLRGEGYQFAAP